MSLKIRMNLVRRLASLVAAVLIAPVAGPVHAEMAEPFKSEPVQQSTLDRYQWDKRPVLVFAPSERDRNHAEQIEILKAGLPGLAERDIVVLSDTNPQKSKPFRDTLRIEGFEVVLIGKDGGVKLRSNTPVSLEQLFQRIDGMPMRQREMLKQPRSE
ncbi:MAG: DUF4174 domain-containing protein [Pseudomonadota bacterium]